MRSGFFAFQKRGVIMMANHRGKFMIIQPPHDDARRLSSYVKPIGSIICQAKPGVGAQADNVAGISGNFWLNKTMLCCPFNCGAA